MAVLDVLSYPHKTLRQKAVPVTEITDDIRRLLDDMVQTMRAAPGIGLAAPQIGISKRIFVIDQGAILGRESEQGAEAMPPLKVINPELVEACGEETPFEEGCLSLPGVAGDVVRPSEVTLRYMDENGETQTLSADGLLAKCIQHEFDHLNGVLFFDHMSKLRRDRLLKRYEKLHKSGSI